MKLYLRIAVSLYLLLLLAAGLDYVDLWGAYHLALFPTWLVIACTLVSFAMLWLPIGSLSPRSRDSHLPYKRERKSAYLVLLLVAAGVLFTLGQSRNHLLGDGYRELASTSDEPEFSYVEYLDAAAHRLVYSTVGDAELSYLILGVLSGILFVLVAYLFARRLSPDPILRAGSAICILGIGQIQFFFGYVGSYSIMTALVALYLYLGFESVLKGRSIWAASAILVLAGLFHASAWSLAPSLIFLFWIRGTKSSNVSYKAISILLLAALVVAAVMLFGKLQSMDAFVPLQPTEDRLYSLFSGQHFADLANIVLLVAPFPVAVYLGSLFRGGKFKKLRSRRHTFLLLCLAGGLVLTFLAEPDRGAIRDWDKLALFGVPLGFLAAWSGTVIMRGRGKRYVWLTTGLAVLIMHTAPWVASNTSKTLAVEQIKKYVTADVHYSLDHLRGQTLKSWGYTVERHIGDLEEAERVLLAWIETNTEDIDAWLEDSNASDVTEWLDTFLRLARISYSLGKYEEAKGALSVFEDITPQAADRFKELVVLYIQLGELETAARKMSIGIEWFPTDPDVHYLGGVIGKLTKDYRTAAMLYQKAVVLSPRNKQFLLDYAEVLIELGDYGEAEQMLQRASALPDVTSADERVIAAFRRRMGN